MLEKLINALLGRESKANPVAAKKKVEKKKKPVAKKKVAAKKKPVAKKK